MRYRTALLFLGIILVLGVGIVKAQTRTLTHTAVTSYVDNTPIEAGNAVTYSIWMQDNVTKAITQISNRVATTSHAIDDSTLVKGRAYNFWGKTYLSTGASSDNSAIYVWVNPTGQAKTFLWVGVQ